MSFRIAVYCLLLFFIISETKLGAIVFDSKISVKNRITKDVQKETILNPDNMLKLGYPLTDTLSGDADIKTTFNDVFSVTFTDTAFMSYSRFEHTYRKQKDWDFNNDVKQLYATAGIGEIFFVDAGRKVETNGVSFYKNPSDFLKSGGSSNLSRSKDEQDAQLIGTVLVKAQYYISDRLVAEAVYSPKYTRVDNKLHQTQGRISYQTDDSDFDVICYYGDVLKLGSNVSGNLGESAELHLEAGIAQKGKRFLTDIQQLPPTATEKETFYGLDKQTMNYPWNTILGGHYTFKDGSDVYAEYYYNHIGYTEREWNKIIRAADQCHDVSLFFNKVSLYNVNSAVRDTGGITSARRHYVFLRYSKDDFFLQNFNFASIVILGIEEPGGLVTVTPSYDVSDNIDASIDITLYGGTKKSEFELMYSRFSLAGEVKYSF
jgi:hypothetical protein